MAAGALGWEGGPSFWRVRYTAGYAEIPPAIEEACAEWVAELLLLTKRDPAATVQNLTGMTAGRYLSRPMPDRVKALLAPWRAFAV